MNKYLSHSIFLIIAPFVSAQMDETKVILEGLESRKFSAIHQEEFILRSREYFNIQKDLTQIPSIKVGRESYTLYPLHGLLRPSTEDIFYNTDSTRQDYTEEEVLHLFQDSTNWLTNRIVAYNKLLFNDDPEATNYFLENLEDAKEVVIDFGYDKDEHITKYVVKNLELEQLDQEDMLKKLLFYQKDGTFRHKVADIVIKKRDEEFINQIANRLIDSWNNLSTSRIDAITYFLRVLEYPDNVENSNDRYDFMLLKRLANKDPLAIQSIEKNRYANSSIYRLIDDLKGQHSTR